MRQAEPYDTGYDFFLDLVSNYGREEGLRIANSYLDTQAHVYGTNFAEKLPDEFKFCQELYQATQENRFRTCSVPINESEGKTMYGILFKDGHIEPHKTFDDAWNHSRGNIDTIEIVIVNVRNDGSYEIIDHLINL